MTNEEGFLGFLSAAFVRRLETGFSFNVLHFGQLLTYL